MCLFMLELNKLSQASSHRLPQAQILSKKDHQAEVENRTQWEQPVECALT